MTRAVKTAADLPAGTEVIHDGTTYTKTRPGDPHPWSVERLARGTYGALHTDADIDAILNGGGIISNTPSCPGHYPTNHMPVGTVVEYGDGWAQKRKTRHDPWPWHSRDGVWYGDEWVQQQINSGATVTYPEGN